MAFAARSIDAERTTIVISGYDQTGIVTAVVDTITRMNAGIRIESCRVRDECVVFVLHNGGDQGNDEIAAALQRRYDPRERGPTVCHDLALEVPSAHAMFDVCKRIAAGGVNLVRLESRAPPNEEAKGIKVALRLEFDSDAEHPYSLAAGIAEILRPRTAF